MTENTARDKTYNYLLKEYGKEKLEERFLFLLFIIREFIKNRKIDEYVFFNKKVLRHIVIDYFADVLRLKKFHNINKINPLKVAVYTCYWIYKRKPLYLIKDPDDKIIKTKPFLSDVNESFCIYILIFMRYNKKRPLMGDDPVYQSKKYREYIKQIHYFLTYRVVTAQALEIALMGLESYPSHELFDGGLED